MRERDALSEQTQLRRIGGDRLRVAQNLTFSVRRITADRVIEMPEMDSNLIRTSCPRDHFQQRCPVRKSREDSKFRASGKAMLKVDLARSDAARFIADR